MTLYAIEAGNFKLDGGAMFGVVPKVLWHKTNPADAQNRIDMASRLMLIEEGNQLILIDTGMGNKQGDTFFGHYGLLGPHSLAHSLKKAGFHQDEITDVFFTHLHFDHCGGAIVRRPDGLLVPAFKNATYWVHENHWEWATKPNDREKASFLPENILPIEESGQLQFVKGAGPYIDDASFPFSIIIVDGHTDKQMLPLLNYRGEKILYAADLIPTVGHLPIPYVMGYDTRPLLTLQEKKLILNDAEEKNILLFLEHDPYHELVSLCQTEKGVRMKSHTTLFSSFGS